MINTSHMPPSRCLHCGKICDAATNPMSKTRPAPGDVSVCFYCGHLSVFDENYKLRPLTDAEMVSAAGDKRIIKIQAARLKVMGHKR